jgi:hypothetical protein
MGRKQNNDAIEKEYVLCNNVVVEEGNKKKNKKKENITKICIRN